MRIKYISLFSTLIQNGMSIMSMVQKNRNGGFYKLSIQNKSVETHKVSVISNSV